LDKLSRIESATGHCFKNRALLKQALTHSSYACEQGRARLFSNERMEFLGDSILGFLVGRMVYAMFPDEEEGVLSRLKAYWVSADVMAGIASNAGIGDALNLGTGEAKSGGCGNTRNLSGALEAVLAAIFIDAGFKKAESAAARLWKSEIKKAGTEVLLLDSKTRLQEIYQKKYKDAPVYTTTWISGAFVSEAVFQGKVIGKGEGPSKKKAEQEAARSGFDNFNQEDKKER
jgi:ribonuclease III